MTDTTEVIAATPAPEATAPVEPIESTVADPAPTEEPTEDSAPSDESGEGSADDARPRRKGGGFQKRIDELTRDKYETELRLQAAERERDALKKQSQTDLSADPGAEPTLEDFDTVELFKAAYREWATRTGYQKAQLERTEKEQQDTAIAVQAKFQTRVDDAKRKYPDFAAVVTQVAPFIDGTPTIQRYIMSSETGTDLSYHLGKNPAALLDLTRLDPDSQIRELVKMEMRLAAAPPPKTLTNTPPPIKAVGARESVPVTLGDLAKSEDASAYIRKANQRRAN